MHHVTRAVALSAMAVGALALAAAVGGIAPSAAPSGAGQGSVQTIDLAERLAAGRVRAVNRQATKADGRPGAVRVSEGAAEGVAWIEGIDFAEGTLEIDVRGRDAPQQSFVGVAFHRKDDKSYEAVYLRPFNFRATDPVRRDHALQYMSVPDFDWPRLRKEFPEEFENPVDQSLDPNGWVPVRVIVKGRAVQIFVGPGKAPALEARKLGELARGGVGLWVGNNSSGDFANLRITPAR